MNHAHVTFVVFGGTGDLTKKKLAPAFAQLLQDNVLTKDSVIVGVARGEFTHDSYKAMLLESAKTNEEKEAIKRASVLYLKADSSQKGSLKELSQLLKTVEQESGHQRIFYLATSFTLFPSIVDNLVLEKLNKHAHGSKIVFEKPFGSDLNSAKKIEAKMHTAFDEDQMYRIDHYLGKETIQNIVLLKYANPFIESLLTNKFVSKIEIVADEKADVGNRLGYYNGVGAIKDMIQSHLLQVAALVLMKSPKHINAESIRDAKVAVLKKLRLASPSEQLIGTYSSFADELKQQQLPDHKTETFARLTFYCNNSQWRGVPIAIQSGKKLNKKYGQVVVHFSNIHAIDKSHGLENVHHNKLVIDIHPTEDIKLYMNMRRRASSKNLDYLPLDFCGECHYGPNTTDGYKRLLGDVILGDKTLFTRTDEVLASWKAISPIKKMRSQIKHVIYPDNVSPEDIK